MDFPALLDELYATPPGEFTATRDAHARRARSDGDRELADRIAGLKKPPVPAWAVNLLVRERHEDVEQLLELGAAMREATDSLAGPELRELGVQQHKVLDAMRVQAGRLTAAAGVRLSFDVGEKVVATLRAAMSDPAAADAVRSGLLVRPLEATGFGEVDVDGATATDAAGHAPATPRRATPSRRGVPPDELRARREEKAARDAEREEVEAQRREQERRELEEALGAAREELDDARDEAGSVAGDLASAQRRADDLTRRQEDLQAKLAAVAEQLEAAAGTLRSAERAAHAAEERVTRAQRELDRLESRRS